MKYILFILIALVGITKSFADDTVPKNTVQVGLQLYSNNNEKLIALNFKNYPGWHTYWRNPGDAGLPLEIKFFQNNKEIKLDSSEWPTPTKFIEQGNMWAFGYADDYTIFYPLKKDVLKKLINSKLDLKAKWLVCKNICVPGSIDFSFSISNEFIKADKNDLLPQLEQLTLDSRFKNIPAKRAIPDYLKIELHRGLEEKTVTLAYKINKTYDFNYIKKSNFFIPYPQTPFDFKHELLDVHNDSLNAYLPISWDGEYQTPPEALPANGKFKKPYSLKFLINDPVLKETYIIEKKFDSFKNEILNYSAKEMVEEKKNDKSNPAVNTENQLTKSSLLYYLVFSFIGGLILNVMPCVLPVISLKLFGLIKYQKESRSRILKHNIFYTLGVLTSFIILAGTVLILKDLGTTVGWGFQLQSPNFIAVMIVSLFIFALNLFGLFEFMTPGGSKLGNLQTGDNFFGDFLGGVFATILSTPCSAPFLGTALTFAFSSDSYIIILVFMMIGLGLAFPFILTGIFPNLVSFLPRPGNWMNTLKKLLGVTLILTLIWLFDVYNALVSGQGHLIKLLTILVLIFVGFLFHRKEKLIMKISFALSIILFVNLVNTKIIELKETSSLIKDKQATGLDWQPWSEASMEKLKNEKQVVFMDFTAKWCFTCKVNEKLVLETDEFKNLVQEKNIKLLIADWTKRDEVIGNFLIRNKLAGVPAYFIQKEDGTLISLGETITIQKIKDTISK